jgi:hypothetical protein
MRIWRVVALSGCLVAAHAALAENLSGKLEALERGAAPGPGKVQVVPGLELPQQIPGVLPEPEPPAAGSEAALAEDPEDAEDAEDPDRTAGESVGGGSGLTVEPRVQSSPDP